jgi:hypothetical protein
MIALWNKFWFDDKRPYNPLGLMRLLAVTFWISRINQHMTYMRGCLDLPPGFLTKLLGHYLVPLPYPLPEAYHRPFGMLLYAVAALALLGLYTRVSLAITSLGAIYLSTGLTSGFLFDHHLLLTVYVLVILTFAPGSDQLSLDSLIRWWRGGRREPLRELASFAIGGTWGYKLILCVIAVVYMTAGLSKLRYSDLRWINGETLGYYLSQRDNEQVYFGVRGDFTPELQDGRVRLVDHAYGWGAAPAVRPYATVQPIMALFSTATVALELSSPLLLAAPPLRALYAVSAFAMHQSIDFSMDIGFFHYRVYLLVLMDWLWIAGLLRSGWRRDPYSARLDTGRRSLD